MPIMISLSHNVPPGWIWLLFAVSLFLATYIVTSLDAFIETRWPRQNAKAPLAPYAIPFVGHALPFFIDTTKLASMVR